MYRSATGAPCLFALCIYIIALSSVVANSQDTNSAQNDDEPCERKQINVSDSATADARDKGTEVLKSRINNSLGSSAERTLIAESSKSKRSRKARYIANDPTATVIPTKYPPPLSPNGIANVTVADITNSSATIIWEHIEGGDERDYRLVGYEVEKGNLLVKEKTVDIYVVAGITWKHRLGQEDLRSDTSYLFCVLPIYDLENEPHMFSEISEGGSVINSNSTDCIFFTTLANPALPAAPCNKWDIVAVVAPFSVLILLCFCIILAIVKRCETSEGDDAEEAELKGEKRSLLGKLFRRKRKSRKRDPFDAKYLGEDRPDFGEISSEVHQVLK